MGRLLVVIIPLALMIYALIDCARTPEDSMPSGIPKALWLVLIIFPVLGPLAWILISRIASAEASAAASGRPIVWTSQSPHRPSRRPGPTAPDDDPDFLARLAREQRRAQREHEAADGGADPAAPDAGRPADTNRSADAGRSADTNRSAETDATGGTEADRPSGDDETGSPGSDTSPGSSTRP
ncbi:MAG: PLD nuclease N-terminal domain-containing protein [Georgenia sp.]